MATNFPASLDSLTNPTSSDSLNSPSHSAQHANSNDAIEAIETALLDGAPLHIDDANERVGVGNVSPSYALDVTGDINASGDLRIGGTAVGNWVDFSASQNFGPSITVGNGTVESYYAVVNDIVFMTGIFTLGSTSAVAGNFDMNVPFTPASPSAEEWTGSARFHDDSGNVYYTGQPVVLSGIYRFAYHRTVVAGSLTLIRNGDCGATAPFIWAINDFVSWSFSYRRA